MGTGVWFMCYALRVGTALHSYFHRLSTVHPLVEISRMERERGHLFSEQVLVSWQELTEGDLRHCRGNLGGDLDIGLTAPVKETPSPAPQAARGQNILKALVLECPDPDSPDWEPQVGELVFVDRSTKPYTVRPARLYEANGLVASAVDDTGAVPVVTVQPIPGR